MILRLAAFLLGVLIATSASAQQAEQEYTIKLKESEVALLEQMLGGCPMAWAKTNPLIKSIVTQVDPQQKAIEKPPPEASKP